jgi:hypothetical protein
MCGDVRSTEDCVDKSGGNALGRKEIDMMNTKTLEKHIVGENGIGYTLGADGLYYPDLKLTEGTCYVIGRYGRMRGEYLKNYRRGDYIRLLLEGGLNEYLHEIDEKCYELMDRLVEQMKLRAGITEELKAADQMKWVRLMNNVRSAAEEKVLKEVVYI